MSAGQVIDEIKNLSREEQELVIAFVQKLQQDLSSQPADVRYMDPAKAKAISEKVFSEHAELFRKLAQ